MDALRRAEASAAESPANDEPAGTAPDPAESPADAGDLQLEPMDAPLPGTGTEASNSETAEPEAAAETSAGVSAPAEPVPSQQQAQATVTALSPRRSSTRRQLVFVGTGLATVALLLAGYYFWESNRYVAPQVPLAATLIEASPPVAAADDSSTLKQVIASATDSMTDTVAGDNPAAGEPSRVEATTASPAAQTSPVNPSPATSEPSYRIEIRKSRKPGKIPSALKQAYQDYQRQDYAAAEQGYRQVLRRYPGNRDAMLGLAAIALHQGNRQVAHYYYERLLQVDPSDKTARLALQSLSARQHSLENGSQIKYWLQTDKDNAQLHAALGNQYAADGQWKEAQQAYFEAHRIAPDNADYAFNLAVSLDQLQQPRQALAYYTRARSLADKGGALFSPQQLDRRIVQLQAMMEQAP